MRIVGLIGGSQVERQAVCVAFAEAVGSVEVLDAGPLPISRATLTNCRRSQRKLVIIRHLTSEEQIGWLRDLGGVLILVRPGGGIIATVRRLLSRGEWLHRAHAADYIIGEAGLLRLDDEAKRLWAEIKL